MLQSVVSGLVTADRARTFVTQFAAEQMRRGFATFAKRAWTRLLPTPAIWNWHMDAVAEHLVYVTLGEIRFLMVSMPPRHSKTMLCTVLWPAWHWLHIPGEQFLTASVDAQLASDASILSRRLIESDWFQLHYPDELTLFEDENNVGMFRNTKGGYRETASVQGRVTGSGGTTQLLDDPHDAKKVESDKVRHGTLAWHDNAWRSRLNNPDTAKKVYVGQRTHAQDVFGHVLEQEGSRWVHLVLPMEYDPKRICITYPNRGDGPEKDKPAIFKDPRTKEGEVLDPKRMSAKTANAEKAIMSERGWQAQYNQAPVGTGGLILKRGWWRPWVEPAWRPNAGAERPMPKFTEIIQVYDTAFEPDEENDYSARTTWGLFRHTEIELNKQGKPVTGDTRTCAMLLDAMRERYAYPDLRDEVLRSYDDFDPDWVLVEKKASGHDLIHELRRQHIPVKGVMLNGSSGRKGRQGDLITRAHVSSLMLEKGCIFYPLRPFAYMVMDEAAAFPNDDHDDLVASIVIAWQYMRKYHDLQLPDDEKDDISPYAWEKQKRAPRKRYA